MTDTPAVATEVTPAPRRRWPRVLLVVVILLLALVLLAPVLLAPWVSGAVVDEANSRLDGRAGLDELSFGWDGDVHVSGVSVTDRTGAPVLALQRLDAEVDVLDALSGRISARVRADGLRLELRRDDVGSLNVESVVRDSARDLPGGAGDVAPPDELPEVHLDVQLTDSQLVVHDGPRATTLDELQLRLEIDGLDRPAPFELSATVLGPDGPGGAVSLRGEVTVAEGGRLDARDVRGRVDLAIQHVLLAALQPALALAGEVPQLSGELDGEGSWTVAGSVVEGRTELRLSELHAAGGLLAAPLLLPEARLVLEASAESDGTGRQSVELTAGDSLELRWTGELRHPLQAEGLVQGELSLDAQLGPALATVRGLLPLKEGLVLDGTLRLVAHPTLRLRAGQPAGGELDLSATLRGVAAREASGEPLDLGELRDADLTVRAGFDVPAGALRLDELRLAAGPLSASARAGISGVPLAGGSFEPAALAVQEGDLQVDADLDRLASLVGRVVDLRGLSFGGRVQVASTLSGGGQRLQSDATVDVTGLHVGGAGVDDLAPLDLKLRQRGTLDLTAGGRSEIQELSLDAEGLHLTAQGAFTDVADPERIEGVLQPTLTVQPAQASAALAPVLDGLAFSGDELSVSGTLQLHGREASLSADVHASALGATGGPLAGQPVALGPLRVELTAVASEPGGPISVHELLITSNGGRVGESELPPVTLSVDADVDPRDAGSALVRALRLLAPGVELQASGSARGLLAGGLDEVVSDAEATLTLRPDELAERLGALPGGATISGAPMSVTLEGSSAAGLQSVKAAVRGERFELTLPGAEDGAPRTLAQQDLQLDVDASVDLHSDAGNAVIRALRLSSQTAQLDLSGTLSGLFVPGAESADLDVGLQADLARVLADLSAVLPPGLPDAAGKLELRGTLQGEQGRLGLASDTTIADLDVTVTGETPMRVQDPLLSVGLDADFALPALDVDFRRATVASRFVNGSVTGKVLGLAGSEPRLQDLRGELRYVPDQLGALLGPLIPARLSGTREETLTFRADGPLAGADLQSRLMGLDAEAQLGTGTLDVAGLQLGGTTTVQSAGGLVQLGGDLDVNGGQLALEGTLDLRPVQPEAPAPHSRLAITLAQIPAQGELGRGLAALHPLFASASGELGDLGAILDGKLELAWDGELPLQELLSGAADEPLPLEPLSGSAHLSPGPVTLTGSPLLGEMLSVLGAEATQSFQLDALALELHDGRLAYAEPWSVAVGDAATTFTGSVGLDGSLDLAWNVPVTPELVEDHAVLAALVGQTLSVPLEGTLAKPRLRWSEALQDLAEEAARAELARRLTGGGGEGGAADDPDTLLQQADALWAADKHDEARPLYKRIKDDFKLSLTYLLNKDRIDERARKPKKS